MANPTQRRLHHHGHTPHGATPLRYTAHTSPTGRNIRRSNDWPSTEGRSPDITPPEVREVLMGFTSGDTAAEGLTPDQRIHILGQCTDLNIMHWTLTQVTTNTAEAPTSPTRAHPGLPWENTYTFSQPLPNLEEAPALPTGNPPQQYDPTIVGTPPRPTPWTPKFSPEEWIYTDGSDIKDQPRLGAAVVHIPTRTTIYIDATGCEETHTIMRAELVAIHTALNRFKDH